MSEEEYRALCVVAGEPRIEPGVSGLGIVLAIVAGMIALLAMTLVIGSVVLPPP